MTDPGLPSTVGPFPGHPGDRGGPGTRGAPAPWDGLLALRPDAHSVHRVRSVWATMADRRRSFVLGAMRAMAAQVPERHPLNPSSGSTAGLELLDALIDAVEARSGPETLEQGWLKLGRVHAENGLVGLDYRPLGHAVFRAAHEVFVDVWSTELGSAWVAYYVWVSEWVQLGSRTAPPQHPGPPRR